MSILQEAIKWERHSVGADAAFGSLDLVVGEIGSGKPVGLVTAGIHGDEGPWGALAIHKLLSQIELEDVVGTLRIVPVANPLAMQADARNAPLDTLDLNRSFPGNPEGSHTERLAATLAEHVLHDVDVVIDLHGGGSWCINSFAFSFPDGEELSLAFDAPFIINGPERDVTLTGYARSKGAIAAAIEMGGRSEKEEDWADRIASGLRRALGIGGVLSPLADNPESVSIPITTSTVLRPSRGGVFHPAVRTEALGTIVKQGTILGYLLDPVTHEIIETFTAPYEETALMLLRPSITRIEGGAMTYVVGEPLKTSN